MDKEKLGLEPAFPFELVTERVGGAEIRWTNHKGISKRFYAACAAMRLSNEQINTSLRDDDMVEDEKGYYIKSIDSYFIPDDFKIYKKCKRYSIKKEHTYTKRLVRFYYEIADELLKQEKL